MEPLARFKPLASEPRLRLLLAVHANPGKTQVELAELVERSQASVSKAIEPLVAGGFVEVDPAEGRKLIYQVSALGAEAARYALGAPNPAASTPEPLRDASARPDDLLSRRVHPSNPEGLGARDTRARRRRRGSMI